MLSLYLSLEIVIIMHAFKVIMVLIKLCVNNAAQPKKISM